MPLSSATARRQAARDSVCHPAHEASSGDEQLAGGDGICGTVGRIGGAGCPTSAGTGLRCGAMSTLSTMRANVKGCREGGGDVDGRAGGADDDGQGADQHRVDHRRGEDERGVSGGSHTGLAHADEDRYGRVGAERRDEANRYALEGGPAGRPAHPSPDGLVTEPALQQRHPERDRQ